MTVEFHCRCCRTNKPIECKAENNANKHPMCKSCFAKLTKNLTLKTTVVYVSKYGRPVTAEDRRNKQMQKNKESYLSGKMKFPQ